jgi:hypothetical protein
MRHYNDLGLWAATHREFGMALTHKPTRRRTPRTKRKPGRAAADTHEVIERIDAMIRELEAIRRELATLPKAEPKPGITQELFGAAGKGT